MENSRPQRKILKSPSVKRKSRSKALPVNQRVQLERVLGVTVSSNAGLCCDSNNGTIAYPAGCVTVLFNPRRNRQSHIFNSCKKTVTALAFSPDGKHLVTGETGHQPAVRVWDIAEKVQVAEFHGHRFGISCVAFSPNLKEVVSVGTQHDMIVNVWNWKTHNKIASNKISSKVSAMAFSEDGSCFITVGNRHVKFWYLDEKRSKINQTVPLRGRSGVLQEHKDNHFCDVAAGVGPMCGHFYVITQSGLLCEFNDKRQLDKWVELRTKSATCITAGVDHIFVGCVEGVVRVFSANSLYYLCSLPKPHYLGVEVTTATSPSSMVSNREGVNYPDTMAIAMDDDHKKVTCVYNDRSIYIWDVHDLKKVGKAWSFLYHSGCIWALEVYPPIEDGTKPRLPPGSFLTASGDDTIRVWNLNTHMPEDTAYRRNIYSNELLKIVYSDPTLTNLCNVDYNPAGAADKTDTNYDGKNGVRSIRVSPDGADLASGDRQGNIRIYDMEYLNEKRSIEAHESDVMCLEYSYTSSGHLLATASRDRLIHVFDVDENYGLLQTLGDHSSSITAVRFTDNERKLRMISCGADKSILIRNAVDTPEFQFQLEQHLATKITLYDMVIDPTQKVLATACQDRNVRLYNIQTTKEKKCYRGSMGDEGILLRIHLDPSGSLAATSCTDKNVCILDFQTGELLAIMQGHSEVITGVRFANDLKHVITCSADGCIFVWRMPSEMTAQIKSRLMDLGKTMKDTDFIRSDQPLMPNPVNLGGTLEDGNFPVLHSDKTFKVPKPDDESVDGREDDEEDEEDGGRARFDDSASQVSLDYRFSIGQLPNWAKAKFVESQPGAEGGSSDGEEGLVQPKGRWAQRVDHTAEFKSQLDLTQDEDSSSTSDRRRPSNDARALAELRRETVVLSKQLGQKNVPIIGDDQGTPPGIFTSGHGKSILGSSSKHSADSPLTRRWTDSLEFKNSLDLDDKDDLDTGSDMTEVIYPPTDNDADLFASSYKVFGLKDGAKSSIGNVSNLDDASESTDPVSLEEEEDGNDETLITSNPTTPSSDPDKQLLPSSPNKEDFVRENFEEDTFTPIPLEKFMNSLDKAEMNTAIGASESFPFSPRLSLSARFMSRSQHSAFKGASGLSGPHRADNWFTRNKMEMTRAMDETRKSLLAMNLRSESQESESPEREEPTFPPTTNVGTEAGKFPDLSKAITDLSSSPPSGINGESRLGQGRNKESPQKYRPNRVTPPTITSPVARRISQERRRSSTMTDHEDRPSSEASDHSSSDMSTARPPPRARPTYFKTTLSSRSKTGRNIDAARTSSETQPSPTDSNTITSGARDQQQKKKVSRRSGRLLGSKVAQYASSPNLFVDEDEAAAPVAKPKKSALKFTSTSNLRLLSDLSRSVPDVNDADASTDSSSGSSETRRPPGKHPAGRLSTKTAWAPPKLVRDQKLMPPPASVPTGGTSVERKPGSSSSNGRRKSSTSEMTLDQAKSILLGNSGILGNSGEQQAAGSNQDPVILKDSSHCDSTTSVSSTCTLTPGTSPSISSQKQLAVEQEIEETTNMLRHQQHAGTFSPEHLRDMGAVPLDLPERDQPSPGPSSRRHSSPKPQGFLSGQSPHPSMPARTAAINSTFCIQPADPMSPHPDQEASKEEENSRSVRERIALYSLKETRRESSPALPTPPPPGRSSSPYRRSLPMSPLSQSDTGLGSESDTDRSQHTARPRSDANSKQPGSNGSQSPPQAPPSLAQCQSVVAEVRSSLHRLTQIYSQLETREEETSPQALALLESAIQEAHSSLTALSSRTPRQPATNGDSQCNSTTVSGLSSLEPSKTSLAGPAAADQTTFQSIQTSNGSRQPPEAKPSLEPSQASLLSAAKDMLNPLVSQLSQDLCEELVLLIKDKLNATSDGS